MQYSEDIVLDNSIMNINRKYIDFINLLHNPSLEEVINLSNNIIHDIMHTIVKTFDLIPIIGFSGGKESTALLHLIVKIMKPTEYLDELKVVYIEIPGNTHEENIEYVYSIIDKLKINPKNFIHLRAELDFYEAIKRWGFPSFRRRWCMNVFKKNVLIKYIKTLNKRVVVFIGDRFSDSPRRSKILSMKGLIEYNKTWNQYTAHPIAHWKLSHVLLYLALNNIELNPLYYKIGSSGNCIYCPFITDIEYYKRLREYYPEWYRKILQVEQHMRNGGGALFVANKVFRLHDVLELNNVDSTTLRLLRYKRPCYYCMF